MRKINIFLTTFLLLLLIQSCITDKYDFDKDMELSVHFSTDGLMLGGKNNADIPLSQVIELNENGQLTTDIEGNYLFYKSGDDMKSTEIRIGEGSLGLGTDTTITYHIKTGGKTTIKPGRFLSEMNFSHSWDINYKNDHQGSSVRDFAYITTPMTIEVYTYFNEITDFTDNVTLTYEIPSYYDIADESQLSETLMPDELKREHYHVINIIGVDFKRTNLREGERIGFKSATGDMIMKGNVTVKGEAMIMESDYIKTKDPSMTSHIIVGSMGTTAVKGRFNKSERVSIDPISFENLPKFIQNDEVQIDIENPVVRLSLDNEAPFNVKMDASMIGYKNDKRISTLNVGETYGTEAILFAGADEIENPKCTNIWLSRIPLETPEYVDKNVVVSNMMDLIKTVPDRIEVLAEAHTDSTQEVTLSLGQTYKATPKYELVAPLKMGPNMKIVYTTEVDSLYDKLKDTNVGELYFNADVTNNIPLDLSIEVHPLNANGDILDNIQIITPESIPGLSTKNITFRLINSSDNQMSQADRISIKAYALSSDKMAGQYLNKNQNIRLDNVKLQIKDTSINF